MRFCDGCLEVGWRIALVKPRSDGMDIPVLRVAEPLGVCSRILFWHTRLN